MKTMFSSLLSFLGFAVTSLLSLHIHLIAGTFALLFASLVQNETAWGFLNQYVLLSVDYQNLQIHSDHDPGRKFFSLRDLFPPLPSDELYA